MRLQITILRNNLSPVRNIFNTDARNLSGGPPVYISDLLRCIDKFVQLETENWGFEDYVVETRLNGNQKDAYECFHYQAVADVFKEDDEVVIRPLDSRELKERKRNGRHQVDQSGMHLFDGVPWGRDKLSRHRPRIEIPSRKETEAAMAVVPLTEEPFDNGELSSQLYITGPSNDSIAALTTADLPSDDEEDDEDFNQEDGSSILASDESEVNEVERVNGRSPSSQFQDGSPSVRSSSSNSSPAQWLGKRKRSSPSEGRKLKRRALLLPKGSASTDSSPETAKIPITNGTRRLKKTVSFENGVADATSDDASSDESYGADETLEPHSHSNGIEPAVENDTTQIVESKEADDTLDTSSSDSDSTSDETSSDTDTSSNSSSETYSSDSSSDDSSSSAQSQVSQVTSEKAFRQPISTQQQASVDQTQSTSTQVQEQQPTPVNEQQNEADFHTSEKLNVPPGQGQAKTRRNNQRKKLSKIMKRLKEEGKLPLGSGFDELRTYLANYEPNNALDDDYTISRVDAEELKNMNLKRDEIFEKLNFQDPPNLFVPERSVSTHIETTPIVAVSEEVSEVLAPASEVVTSTIMEPTEEDSGNSQPAVAGETSSKRARLDAASSRRLIFGALGVRNPKTQAAEQALREKLAKPVRQVRAREDEQSAAHSPQADHSVSVPSAERWKDKLIIKAVECVAKHRKLEVPPFPFQHPWQVRKEKEQLQRDSREHDTAHAAELEIDETDGYYGKEINDPQDPLQTTETSHVMTTDLTEGDLEVHAESLPIPSDFDSLFDLNKSDLVAGAIIAYKELHLNDNFEPSPSSYRVAKILSTNNDMLQVKLAAQCRESVQYLYDEETGERIFKKFDLPLESNDDFDDGLRDVHFNELIQPKFVGPSTTAAIFVAGVSSEARRSQDIDKVFEQPSSHQREDVSAMPVVNVASTEVSTPRRIEINGLIKDAGFQSALDDQLLKPLPNFETSRMDGEARVRQPSSLPNTPQQTLPSITQTSVASESIVDSVRYPHLSQLELDTPIPSQVQSSSHQDAQRVTPTPEHVGHISGVSQSVLPDVEANALSSLSSAVEQTQYELQDEVPYQASASSDIGPSDAIDDRESEDSNGFPSLRFLSSSQQNKIRGGLSGTKLGSKNVSEKTSPEPLRRSPRERKRTLLTANGTAEVLPHASLSHSKANPSQQSQLDRESEEVDFIDLTQTSPANSHHRSTTVKTKDQISRKSTGTSAQASLFKRGMQGLGESSLLKRKRRTK